MDETFDFMITQVRGPTPIRSPSVNGPTDDLLGLNCVVLNDLPEGNVRIDAAATIAPSTLDRQWRLEIKGTREGEADVTSRSPVNASLSYPSSGEVIWVMLRPAADPVVGIAARDEAELHLRIVADAVEFPTVELYNC